MFFSYSPRHHTGVVEPPCRYLDASLDAFFSALCTITFAYIMLFLNLETRFGSDFLSMRHGFVTPWHRFHELGSSYYEPNNFLQSRNVAKYLYFASFDIFCFIEFVSRVGG